MMKIVTKKLTEIRPMEKNIRRHTEKQLVEYVRSLEMFGQTKPILIDEAGEIIAGNGLYAALVQMGRTTAECRVMEGLSPAMKKKLMLSDNRVYELGLTDMDMFDEILRDLDGDLDIPGWDDDLLEMLNASVSEATDMVESYGVYDQEEVEAMNRRTREEHIPGTGPLAGSETNGAPGAGPSPEEEGNEAQAPGSGPEEAKTITCPHCGGTICLPNA